MIESWHAQLPAEYLREPIYPRLSTDAQLYFICSECRGQYRLNPTVCFERPDMATGMPCRQCQSGTLHPLRHVIRMEAICSDCSTTHTAETAGFEPVRCPNCQSNQYTAVGFSPPRYTSEFGDVMGGAYLWGRDPHEDGQKIVEEVRIASGLPDFVRYMIPSALFARRLHVYAEYPSDMGPARVITIEGDLLREYYRRTGELSAGIASVQVFEESVAAATDEQMRGLAEHNVAMAIYSMLARQPASLIQGLMGRPGIVAEGRAAAERALEIFAAGPDRDDGQHRIQAARIRHLIGDYYKVSAESDDDRRKALAHFDQALGEKALPESLRVGVQDSRSAVIVAMESATPEQRRQAAADFETVVSTSEHDRIWSNKLTAWVNQAIHLDASGMPRRARKAILRAAGIAQDELDRAVDETSMRQAAGSYVMVFDQLARISAKQGRGLEALAAIETVRAASVLYPRGGDSAPATTVRRNVRWQKRAMSAMFGGRSAAASTPRQPYLEDAASRIDRVDDRILPRDAAFLCLSMSSGTVTGLIVTRPNGTSITVHPEHWQIDHDHVEQLGLPLETDDDLAHNLDRLMQAGCRVLLEPVYRRLVGLGIKRLAVSLPGILNRLAFEGMTPAESGSPLAAAMDVYNLPSLVLGVGLASRPRPGQSHLLVVSYLEDDLPALDEEIEALRASFGGAVTVLGGSSLTKGDILEAMERDVSHVHFVCHGTFDAMSPLESALHLVQDPHSDRHRITARDLMEVRFRSGPLVTLAACSSGLTSYGAANDLSGLAGGFIRAGARGVIGSRWNVHDDAASRFMAALYQRLADPTVSPVKAVSEAQHSVRVEYAAVEDWAAFAYLGAP